MAVGAGASAVWLSAVNLLLAVRWVLHSKQHPPRASSCICSTSASPEAQHGLTARWWARWRRT